MKVYSPSSTKSYAFCPYKRHLEQQNLTSKYADKRTVAKWMGVAVAKGLERINQGEDDFVDQTFATWNDEISRFRKAGGIVTDETCDSRVPPLMERALMHYVSTDVLPVTWQTHSIEHEFEHAGKARADLIVIDDGGYAPVDYKMKEKLYVKPGETIDAARARTFLEYENDWQQHHYVWAIRRFLGQPCDHYYIVLGELAPRPHFSIQRFDVPERVIQRWVDNAHSWWADMYDTDIDIINEPRMSKCASFGRLLVPNRWGWF